MTFAYHAFISYSHAADARLAPALQRGLQRLGKPWWRRPTVRVFRDDTSLAANAALWPEIQQQLARCEWFVLLASPAAAASAWVARELAWWVEHREVERILIVVTDGEIAWNERRGHFYAARSSCLPPSLMNCFRAEPLYVDLRWARAGETPSLKHPRFRDAVLTLAASLHGVPKDELDSEDIRQHRQLRRGALAFAVLFGALGMAAVLAAWNAWQASSRADTFWREARSRLLAAKVQEMLVQREFEHDILKVALMAWQLAPTEEARLALERMGAATSTMAGILGQHTAGLADFAFSDDSQRLATLGRDGSVQVWSTASWKAAGPVLAGTLAEARGIVFDGRGERLMVWARSGALELWQVPGQRAQVAPAPGPLEEESLVGALSQDGRFAALADRKGALWIWDAAAASWRQQTRGGLAAQVIGLSFDAAGVLRVVQNDFGVRVVAWDPATDRVQSGARVADQHLLRYATHVAFAGRGARFVAAGDGWATVFDIGRQLALQTVAVISGLQSTGCRGEWLEAGGQHLWVRLQPSGWRRHDLARPADAPLAGKTPMFGCSRWSPDGRWRADVVRGGWSAQDIQWQRLLLWDLRQDTAAAASIDGECRFVDDASRCVQRLCAKLEPTLDEDQLRKLFGIEDFVVMYDRYREVTGRRLCGSAK